MNRKLQGNRALTPFDYFFLIAIFLSIEHLIRGSLHQLYSLSIMIIALVAQLIRFFISRHYYQGMSPTEKETYLENCSPLAYLPRENATDLRTISLFDIVPLVLFFAGISWLLQVFHPLYSLCLVTIAILAEVIRLLIQKHNYQKMTPTEKEIYLENRSLLSYRPRK